MASYQNIDIRLAQVERMLDFVMSHARMRAAVTSDVLGPDGQPQLKVFEGSLKELYYLSQQLPTIDVAAQQKDENGPVAESVAE